MKELIYLSLGSNLGERLEIMEQALRKIEEQVGSLGEVSRIYESEAWGYSSNNRFCNCCVSVRTSLEPHKLLDVLLGIERSMGRERMSSGSSLYTYSDRIIDIDILLYGDLSLDHPRLAIPHPAMKDRRFVLVPLSDIAPRLQHPILGISISQLLLACKDKGKVWPLGQ